MYTGAGKEDRDAESHRIWQSFREKARTKDLAVKPGRVCLHDRFFDGGFHLEWNKGNGNTEIIVYGRSFGKKPGHGAWLFPRESLLAR